MGARADRKGLAEVQKLKRALITGASGFIAAPLIVRLKARGYQLRLTSRKAPSVPGARADGAFVPADLSARAPWKTLLDGIDVVFHLAAQTSIPAGERDPESDRAINVLPVMELIAAAARMTNPPAMLFAGSETEAGLPHYVPMDDAHPDLPITVYDAHKLEAETALLESARRGDLRAAGLRLTNVYGPGPAVHADRGVLNRMLERALGGEALTLYGRGQQLRDYLYVDDAASAFVAAAENLQSVNGRHFLVGSEESVSLAAAFEGAARAAGEITGRTVAVTEIDPPPGAPSIDDRSIRVDCAAFRRATGWKPRWTFEEGLQATARSLADACRR